MHTYLKKKNSIGCRWRVVCVYRGMYTRTLTIHTYKQRGVAHPNMYTHTNYIHTYTHTNYIHTYKLYTHILTMHAHTNSVGGLRAGGGSRNG